MKEQTQTRRPVSAWIFSLFAAFFICVYVLTDRHMEVTSFAHMLQAMNGARLEALCTVILAAILFRKLLTLRNRRALGLAMVGGALFTLCDMVGFNIYYRDSLTRPNGNLFSLALDLACTLGGFLAFTALLYAAFVWLQNHPLRPRKSSRLDFWLGSGRRSFWICFGILMAISIPLQIYFYPGITNPDSFVQISESMKLSPLTDAHPFLHTLMMRLVIGLGRSLFGTIGAGITFYTFFQSTVMSLVISYTLTYMAKRQIHPGLRLATLLYFALHPAIACYNITLWKDIWLSYFLLLYTLLLIEMVLNPEGFFRRNRHLLALTLVILGFLFSKNTGIAVLLVTLPFLLVLNRKHIKRLAAVTVLVLAVFGLVRTVVIPQMGIQKGRFSEPYSVPMQQLARTVVHEGDSLTREQQDTIREIFPYDILPRIYEPQLADNVKLSLNEEAFLADPMRYVKCWLEVGAAHPRAYLESFLANSCGYWYPDVVYWVVDPSWYYTSQDVMAEIGQPDPDADNYQVDTSDYARRHYFVHLYEMLQTVPVVSSLISVAISFWAEFILFLICLLKKKYRMLIPLLVPFVTWLICIFSPVIAEYRYAFPAVVTLPILAVFTLQDDLHLTETLGFSRKATNKK